MNGRRAAIALLVAIPVATFVLVPPVPQWASYHRLTDRRAFFGIPNFWNVATNLPFLGVALWGLRAFRSKFAFTEVWERVAYMAVLAGAALAAAGSSYYHWSPTDTTLVWDRLPMTLVFMGVFTGILGERFGMRAGRVLLAPLLAAGVGSILWWKFTNDLRLYGIVQYLPVLSIPFLLFFFPPRYSGAGWIWAMCDFYALAKIFEVGDSFIGRVIATGGHPWKHLAAAAAVWCYCQATWTRRPLFSDRWFDKTCQPSVS